MAMQQAQQGPPGGLLAQQARSDLPVGSLHHQQLQQQHMMQLQQQGGSQQQPQAGAAPQPLMHPGLQQQQQPLMRQAGQGPPVGGAGGLQSPTQQQMMSGQPQQAGVGAPSQAILGHQGGANQLQQQQPLGASPLLPQRGPPEDSLLPSEAATAGSVGSPAAVGAKGPAGANLYVFGIPDEYSDQKLAGLFAPYGTVVHARLVVDKETGKSKGYGERCVAPLSERRARIRG
eukprot:TRINITY_DN3795_c0_g3_i1.p1 TRINITY_DN3795_c0_g3~~TRINITY_DN3795_c0_g3_i1.p1  ORF type:complete len:257 (+),score=108.94 TRINITY_DN3795_c0_g3_i1:80-772(+)